MEDNSQEAKQTFLRENILEKGYDVNIFVDFLISKKGEEGADVCSWSMNDLQIVVQEFITMQNGGVYNPPIPEPQQSIPQQTQKISDPLSKKKSTKFDPLSSLSQTNDEQKQTSSMSDFFSTNNVNTNNNNKNNVNANISPQQPKISPQQPKVSPQQTQVLPQNQPLLIPQQPMMQPQVFPQMQQQFFPQMLNQQSPIPIQQSQIPIQQPQMPIPQAQIPTLQPQPPLQQPQIPVQQPQIPVQTPESQKKEQTQNQKPAAIDDNCLKIAKYGIISPLTAEIKQIDNTPLTKEQNPIISVGFPEKVEGGFFSKSYVTYLITTLPLNLKVRRRYSDFDWFHQMVTNLFTSNLIPATPRKSKLGSDKFGEVFLQKRMRTLEKFLNYLLLDPIVKNSQLLYDFLSIESEEEFTKRKKEYEKMRPPVNISDYRSVNGIALTDVTKEKEIYFENIKDNININETLLMKLNENLKILKTQIDNLTIKIGEIAQNWTELCKNSTKYFDGGPITETYNQMSKLFMNWSDSLIRNNNLFYIDMREYFKFVKNNFREMKDLVKLVDNSKNNYYKNERNIISKKEDLLRRGDMTKWDLEPQDRNNSNLLKDKNLALPKICYKETATVINLRQYYGYFLNRIISEYERIKGINSNLHVNTFTNMSAKLGEIIIDFHKNIADRMLTLTNESAKLNKNVVIKKDDSGKVTQ